MDRGLGSVTWWGFSPALDLLEVKKLLQHQHQNNRISFCMVGSGDARHILKTIARVRRHFASGAVPILHFYIVENNLETYARTLLMIALALQRTDVMGLQEKVECFAELYGNTLVREQTANCLQKMANEFVKMVTDFDYLHDKLPLFDLELLKYKERDLLEGIFKLWRNPDPKLFDVQQCWDLRVRQHLGTRYDSSKGAFDWDYSMKLSDRGAEIIGSKIYQRWRKTGIAFELREGTYTTPNKTLASGMVFTVEGEKVGRRGYWGDIAVSPYIAYGIECDDEKFFKKANKEYISNSEEITQYNLTSILHELLTGEKYMDTDTTVEPKPSNLEVIGEEDEESAELGIPPELSADAADDRYQFEKCEGVKISFLPLGSLDKLTTKEKYRRLFDVVYFSNSMVHNMVEPINDLFADEALLVLETAKFITEINKEQYIMFAEKIGGMAKALGCESLVDCDAAKDAFSYHTFHRK